MGNGLASFFGSLKSGSTLLKVPPFSSYSLNSKSLLIDLLDGGTTNDWQGRCSIVDLGIWAMIFREAVSHTDNGTGAYHIIFSDDKGLTWTDHDTYLDDSPVSGFPYTANYSEATSTADMIIVRCPNGDLITIGQERDNASEFAAWKAITINRSIDGGKTWSYEGELIGLDGNSNQNWAIYDYSIFGDIVYFVASDHDGDLSSAGIKLYKTEDNFQTISKISTIWPNDGSHYECGIQYMENGKFIAIARQDEQDKTSMKISNDFGLTWGSSIDISNAVGGFGVHQPRLRKFTRESRIYLLGRRNLVYGSTTKNGMWYSDDEGITWTLYTPEIGNFADSGYVDLIKRDDTIFCMYGYEGTIPSARVYEYIIQGNI